MLEHITNTQPPPSTFVYIHRNTDQANALQMRAAGKKEKKTDDENSVALLKAKKPTSEQKYNFNACRCLRAHKHREQRTTNQ